MIERYIQHCNAEPTIPLFCQAWWLDAVAPGQWDAVLVENKNEVIASLPFFKDRKLGFPVLSQPPLTQHLGPWLKKQDCKYAKRLSREKDWLQKLYGQLPDYGYYSQKWHFRCSNWLPLFWKGFKQTTRYTYRLNLTTRTDDLWAGLQENIKTDIKKARGREALVVDGSASLEDFYQLNKMVFDRQGMEMPYSFDLVKRIDEASSNRECRRIFMAKDGAGRPHAAVYLVWDKDTAYYLMGGSDPDLRKSGATSLCLWEAICYASTVSDNFDFEGSMLEPVERFVRGFGAIQTPFHHITHARSRWLGLALAAKELKELMRSGG